MKKIKATQVIKIPDGIHKGKIVAVLTRTDPYEYVDLIIRLPDAIATELRVGYPAKISEMSGLGKLLERFGTEIEVDKEYDVEQLLKNKQCSFMTLTKKSDKGEFANIVPESVKPE